MDQNICSGENFCADLPTDLVSKPTPTIEPTPPPPLVSGHSPTPPGRPQRVKKTNVRLNPEEWELGQLSDNPGQNQISTMELLLELVRRMYEGSKGGQVGEEINNIYFQSRHFFCILTAYRLRGGGGRGMWLRIGQSHKFFM